MSFILLQGRKRTNGTLHVVAKQVRRVVRPNHVDGTHRSRGSANPTLVVAYRIAQAFGMNLGEMIDAPAPVRTIDVIRADDSAYLFRDDVQCSIRTLSPLHLEKDTEFYELRLKPSGKLVSAAHFEGTREFLTIEQGAVRLVSADQMCDLNQGDSGHYAADVPHSIENLGEDEAIAFLVVSYGRGDQSRG